MDRVGYEIKVSPVSLYMDHVAKLWILYAPTFTYKFLLLTEHASPWNHVVNIVAEQEGMYL